MADKFDWVLKDTTYPFKQIAANENAFVMCANKSLDALIPINTERTFDKVAPEFVFAFVVLDFISIRTSVRFRFLHYFEIDFNVIFPDFNILFNFLFWVENDFFVKKVFLEKDFFLKRKFPPGAVSWNYIKILSSVFDEKISFENDNTELYFFLHILFKLYAIQ